MSDQGKRNVIGDAGDGNDPDDLVEYYNMILQSLGEGVALLKDRRYVWINHAMTEISGYSEDELLGQTTDILYAFDEDWNRVGKDAYATISAGDIYKDELQIKRKDREMRWLRVSGRAVDSSDLTKGTIWVNEDITERKLAEQQLRAAKEAAEEANRAKSQFLARMSHELRTPLNSILGYAQILDSLPDDTPIGKERECTQAIAQSGWYLLGLIKDLLDLTAIEADKVEIYLENVTVSPCIDECLITIGPIAKERGINVVLSPKCQGQTVLADRIRLKQVLLNLLTNATKYNRSGGSININCQRVRSDRIRISVSDTGSGIPAEDMATLFEPFNRFKKHVDNIEGTGIGLAVTKHLIELMGGTVGVNSLPGQGSTFWIELKEGEEAALTLGDSPKEPYQAGDASSKNFTMLYIEDSPSHVNLMKRIVAEMGNIEMITAHTPSLGLELAISHKPDNIICDICLPGMDGYELLERLMSDERTRSIPVIAISANVMDREVERGLRAGFRRYISKPIDIVEFRKTLSEMMIDEASTSID